MEQKVNISLDSKAMDNAIEKANQLKTLLQEAKALLGSLKGEANCEIFLDKELIFRCSEDSHD